jgi:hypothetical protein
MFDQTQRLLREFDGKVSIPIPMPIDDDGYFDRRCPSAKCKAAFKVLMDDWKSKVKDEAAYCPICRHKAPATEWNTPEQSKYIRDHVRTHIQQRLSDAMRRDAEAFNRSQRRGGFVTMSMSYKPGSRPIVVPYSVAEIMRQKSECEECRCRYSSVGAAFFCPACGHNSAPSTFQAAVESVRATVAQVPSIKRALKDRDAAEDAARLILEQSFAKLVASFQRFAEATFDSLPNSGQFKRRKNVFQSIPESSALWRQVAGKGYEDLISGAELEALIRFFQQRHLLAHKEGMVDQDYVDKAGDTTYAPGQRLVVRERDVLRLADILVKLAAGIRSISAATT